ncbi:MAG TPA: ATP-dependent 6-phosphofructokinase, partial [Ardenticatenaceae bacterium]|nr:ATP-dependent 6-phosphofructokinase [Ardenticatenaceae bacterium]
MTGGGDAPGMNACVRAVVRTVMAYGAEAHGIRRAYAGLISGEIRQLGPRDVGGIIQKGGTFLQTARLPEFKDRAVQRAALRRLNEADIEALVVIGGDGSLNGAIALQRQGFPVVGIPASIDNDIYGTNMAIGVDTALNTILDAIDKLRDTASSHQRAFLIETMGRDSGYLALMAGITGGAELVHIPEVPMTIEEIAERVEQAYIRGKTHCIILVSEGAQHKPDDIVRHLAQHHDGF